MIVLADITIKTKQEIDNKYVIKPEPIKSGGEVIVDKMKKKLNELIKSI